MRLAFFALLLMACHRGKDAAETGDPGPGQGDDTAVDTDDTDETDDLSAPASILVELSADNAEVGESVSVSVVVYDGTGAELPDAATSLSVEPTTASWSGNTLSFEADGLYVVTATLEGGDLSGSAGPVVVDGNGPLIRFTSPERGAWLAGGGPVTVSGSVTDAVSGVASATLQGEPLSLDGGGAFEVVLALGEGIDTIEIAALDEDGNASDLVLAAISGEFRADGVADPDGMELRLNEGGLAAVADDVEGALSDDAIEAVLVAANPVAVGSYSCIDYEVNVTSFSYRSDAVTLTPTADGMDVQLVLTGLTMLSDADLDLCGYGTLSDVVRVTDTTTTITSSVAMAVPTPGDVEVTSSDTAVTFRYLDVDWSSLDSSLATFGISTDDLGIDYEALLGAAAVDAMEEELPATIEALLEAAVVDASANFMGVDVSIQAVIAGAETDTGGVTLVLQTDVSGSTTHPDIPENPGSWVQGGGSPSYGAGADAVYGVPLDTLNRAVHAAWAGGALNMTVAYDDMGLDPAVLELLFPGAETLDLEVTPILPPVLVPGTGAEAFDMVLGELQVDAWGEVDGEYTHLATVAVFAHGEVATGVASRVVSLELGAVTTNVQSLVEDADRVAEGEQVELLVGAVVPSLLADMFPTIELGDFGLDTIALIPNRAYASGASGTWLAIDSRTP